MQQHYFRRVCRWSPVEAPMRPRLLSRAPMAAHTATDGIPRDPKRVPIGNRGLPWEAAVSRGLSCAIQRIPHERRRAGSQKVLFSSTRYPRRTFPPSDFSYEIPCGSPHDVSHGIPCRGDSCGRLWDPPWITAVATQNVVGLNTRLALLLLVLFSC